MSRISRRLLLYLLAGISLTYLGVVYGPELYRLCSDREALRAYLELGGAWAPALFVLLTAAQVVAAPIPALALGLAGGYVFGMVPGFLLSVLGLFIGSMFAFGLAKRFGLPLVMRLVGPDTYKRMEPLVHGKGFWAVVLIFLLPFMPDDALCFLAALTPMRARLFAFLVLTCRTPGVLVASLTGSGTIALPWEAWAGIGLVSLIALALAWRNSKRIEGWVLRLAGAPEAKPASSSH